LGDPLLGLDEDASASIGRRAGRKRQAPDGRGDLADGIGGGNPDLGDLDLDAYSEPLEPPKGIVTRLFGAESGLNPRPDEDDPYGEDGGRRRSGVRRLLTMAVAGAVALSGGLAVGWWLLQDEALSPPLPMAASETTPSGSVPVLQEPGRVVMTIPPLTMPQQGAQDTRGDGSQVVADATAATDRSVQRRPWLAGGEAETVAPDPAADQGAGHGTDQAGGPAADEGGGHAASPDAATGHGPEGEAVAHGADPNADPNADPSADPSADHGADPGAGHETGRDTEIAEAHGEPSAEAVDHQASAPGAPADHGGDHGAPPGEMAEGVGGDHAAPEAMDMAHGASDGDHGDAPPGETGIRRRMDRDTAQIDLPDVPGLLPVPAGVTPLSEPQGPRRIGDDLRVPTYKALPALVGTRPLPLPGAPFPALQDAGSHGPVPAVGPDGTVPWRAYAARDDAPPEQPRVAIVVHGLGMMADPLKAAISKLPPQVTLSFSPYAPELPDKLAMAREGGHEVLLDLPMEAEDFPARDPGPMGLLSLLSDTDNTDRLDQVLASGTGYVGVMAGSAGRFAVSPDHMEPVLKRLRRAGLLYLHRGDPSALMANRRTLPPVTVVDVVVDAKGYAESVQARLDYLRRLALARGTAVGVMRATPLNFMALLDWAQGLDAAGVTLAPLSSVVVKAGGDEAVASADMGGDEAAQDAVQGGGRGGEMGRPGSTGDHGDGPGHGESALAEGGHG